MVGLDPQDVRRLSPENGPWWMGVVAGELVGLGPQPEELTMQGHGAGIRRDQMSAKIPSPRVR